MGEKFSYRCAKCGGSAFRVSQLRASSGGFAAWMDWQDKLMTCVTCRECRHVDLYDMYVTVFIQEYGIDESLVD